MSNDAIGLVAALLTVAALALDHAGTPTWLADEHARRLRGEPPAAGDRVVGRGRRDADAPRAAERLRVAESRDAFSTPVGDAARDEPLDRRTHGRA